MTPVSEVSRCTLLIDCSVGMQNGGRSQQACGPVTEKSPSSTATSELCSIKTQVMGHVHMPPHMCPHAIFVIVDKMATWSWLYLMASYITVSPKTAPKWKHKPNPGLSCGQERPENAAFRPLGCECRSQSQQPTPLQTHSVGA